MTDDDRARRNEQADALFEISRKIAEHDCIDDALSDCDIRFDALTGFAAWRAKFAVELVRHQGIAQGQHDMVAAISADLDPHDPLDVTAVTMFLDGFMLATLWQRRITAEVERLAAQ